MYGSKGQFQNIWTVLKHLNFKLPLNYNLKQKVQSNWINSLICFNSIPGRRSLSPVPYKVYVVEIPSDGSKKQLQEELKYLEYAII